MNYNGEALFMVIPLIQSDDYLALVNTSNSTVLIGGLLILILTMWKLSDNISKPLRKLQEVARNISELRFDILEIKTGDEIEALANSINSMSYKLKEAHLELKRKNDVLRNAISGMSHETKRPLALTYAYTAGLRDGVVDKSATDDVLSQVERLNYLVDKMIEMSRLDQEELHLTPFDLSELVEENLDAFSIIVRQKGITVTADIARECFVQADRDKINTVVVNLMSNAIKYTDNSWVGVSVALADNIVIAIVKNRNLSLSADALDDLWEPFYVGEKSRNHDLSGTGLGLAIVKTIFEKHGIEYGTSLEDGIFSIYFKLSAVTEAV